MDLSSSQVSLLLVQARSGDREAQGRLLETVRPYLTFLARASIGQRLQGKTDAADLVQETFIEALRDFASFQGGTPAELLAWLRQILVRNLADLLRRYYGTQARDLRLEQQLSVTLERASSSLGGALAADQSSPSEQAARAEVALHVAETLARLPAHYREVLVLREIEGLSFPEVAQQMGRSVDSVEKLWIRALAKLRLSLGGPP
jgi:RNA polymerase sigma-70 factor (ECF subfamily)